MERGAPVFGRGLRETPGLRNGGKEMRRCECGKRIFRDELAAKIFLGLRSGKDKRQECRAYQCEHGRWHTTSIPGRQAS